MVHPLDISHILKRKGAAPDSGHTAQACPGSASANSANAPSVNPAHAQLANMRIRDHHWSRLNPECRRFLTSRVWKGVDFNPLLDELQDLTILTESWMKWAVPTYVNGLKQGPIRDWLDGRSREKALHYVLVGEHLKYMKDKRQSQKTARIGDQAREAYHAALEELGRHLEWLGDFVGRHQALKRAV